jgi:hypothetical protein
LYAHASQWLQEAVGAGVAGAGDLDGDGLPDFFASSHGHLGERGVVIAFSSATGLPLHTLVGARWGSGFGMSIRSGLDLDRDGVHDILIAHAYSRTVGRVEAYSGRDGSEILRVEGLAHYSDWIGVLPPSRLDGFPRFYCIRPNSDDYYWKRHRAYSAAGVQICIERCRKVCISRVTGVLACFRNSQRLVGALKVKVRAFTFRACRQRRHVCCSLVSLIRDGVRCRCPWLWVG